MLFVSRTPAPPLNLWIDSIWYCESAPRPFALERILPNGSAQLVVNLKEDQTRIYQPEGGAMTTSAGAVLSGVASRHCFIDTAEQECVAGVSFRPGGTLPFFAVPPHEMLDRDVPLAFLWGGGRAAELRERLLAAQGAQARMDVMECALTEMRGEPGVHGAVSYALDVFAARPEEARIAAVASDTGLSAKRFIERFKSSVGLAPKQYCRILRFQHALKQTERGVRPNWTSVAMDCGYFDQAHFIHDFRSFSGITPTGYEAARTQFRNHVKFLQANPQTEMR